MPFYRCEISSPVLSDFYQQFVIIFVRGKFKAVSKISNLHIIQVIDMLRKVRVYFAFCKIGHCILDKNFEHLTYK